MENTGHPAKYSNIILIKDNDPIKGLLIMTAFIYSLASVIEIASFTMTNILYLRLLTICSALLFILAGILWHNTSIIAWQIGYLGINIVQIIIYILLKKPILIRKEIKPLYHLFANSLNTRQFVTLCGKSKIMQLEEGATLISQGAAPPGIYLIAKGVVDISLNNKVLKKESVGAYIGEMSHLTNEAITATILTSRDTTVLYWDNNCLAELKRKKPVLYQGLYTSIAIGLAKKLKETNKLAIQ